MNLNTYIDKKDVIFFRNSYIIEVRPYIYTAKLIQVIKIQGQARLNSFYSINMFLAQAHCKSFIPTNDLTINGNNPHAYRKDSKVFINYTGAQLFNFKINKA